MASFATSYSKHNNYINIWFHDSVAPDTRKIIEQMAQTIVDLEEAMVALCLANQVNVYVREEKNAGLSLITKPLTEDNWYGKQPGQWMTSNEACN